MSMKDKFGIHHDDAAGCPAPMSRPRHRRVGVESHDAAGGFNDHPVHPQAVDPRDSVAIYNAGMSRSEIVTVR
jgi:hypothetical protein